MPIEIISPIVQIVQKFQASNMSQFPFKGTFKITVFFFFFSWASISFSNNQTLLLKCKSLSHICYKDGIH